MARHENLHVNKLVTDKVISRAFKEEGAAAQKIPEGVNFYELANTVQITATMDATKHLGFFNVKCTAEPATTHTITLSSGTWNATNNNTATFADIEDALFVHFDSDGNGTVLVNTGTVLLTTV